MTLGDAEIKRFLFDLQGKKEELRDRLNRFRDAKAQRLEKPRAQVIDLEAKLRANEAVRKGKEAEAGEMEQKLQASTQELHGQRPVAKVTLDGLRAEAERERKELQAMQEGGQVRVCHVCMGVWDGRAGGKGFGALGVL